MRRRAVRMALAAATLLPAVGLGGCAVSLFSRSDPSIETDDLDRLERRMDAIEKALDARAGRTGV